MDNQIAEEQRDIVQNNSLLLKFILPIAVLLILVVAFIFLLQGRSLTLPLNAPNSDSPRGGWYLEERARRKWTDSNRTYYIWRVRSNAWSDEYASNEEVMSFLADQLLELGWSRHPSPGGICGNHFAEARFLPEGDEGYLGFVRVDEDFDSPVPITCVAVWQADPGSGRFEVVVQTINPSYLTLIDSWFR